MSQSANSTNYILGGVVVALVLTVTTVVLRSQDTV